MEQVSYNKQQQGAESADMVSKVKALEKDLYYYRKTSRDLRKKLQTLSSSSSERAGEGVGLVEGLKMAEECVNSAPELEGSGGSPKKARRKRRVAGGIGGAGREAAEQRGGIEQVGSIFAAGREGATDVDGSAMVSSRRDEGKVGGAVSSPPKVVVKKHKKELRQLR